MTKHTPGPWHWYHPDKSSSLLLGRDQDPACTSILWAAGCETCAANGRNCSISGNSADLSLIAAAPDLLVVCKALVSLRDDEGCDVDRLLSIVEWAEEAIAKAEGRG